MSIFNLKIMGFQILLLIFQAILLEQVVKAKSSFQLQLFV